MRDFEFEEVDFAVASVRVLQSAHFAAQVLQLFRARFTIGDGRKAFQFFSQFEGKLFFGKGGDAAGALGGVAFGALVGEIAEADAAFFLEKPLLKAAAAPGGDVVFGDGPAGEAFVEDALHFGQRVQPGDEFAAEGAVVEAAIEFVTNGAGQAGDFSSSGSHVS